MRSNGARFRSRRPAQFEITEMSGDALTHGRVRQGSGALSLSSRVDWVTRRIYRPVSTHELFIAGYARSA